MADNVDFQSTTLASPAAGTKVSTEEVTTLNGGAVTAQQVQRVAAALRTADGVAIDLPGDSTNGLDVDVTRVIPGTGATNLGKAEDAAHSSGDTGVMALAVRQDASGAFGADGDYSPLQLDSNGALKVNIVAGAGSGGTAMTDDDAFTPGTTSFTPVGGMFDDVAPDSVNEGDGGVVRMSANRNLYVNIRDNAGNERGLNIDANGALSVGSIIPSTGATNLGKAEDAAHTSGDVGVMALAVRQDASGPFGGDGDYSPLQLDANGALKVNIVAGAGSGGTSMTDDSAFTPGTTSVTPIGAMFDNVAPDSVDEGDAGVVRMSANRNLFVNIRDNAGNERGLNIDANGALAIGDVIPGVAATNLGKAEDAAHTSGDVGVMALAVRQDASGAFGADGDYAPLQLDSSGALKVNIVAGAGSGGTAMVDDAAFTPGVTSFTPVGGMFDDVAPDSVNEGDGGVVRMSANRNLYSTIRDGAGNERGANVTAANELNVLDSNSAAIRTAVEIMDDWDNGASDGASVSGDVAHDTADAGEPVKIGAKAVAHGTNPTAVAADDRTNLYANRAGIQFVIGGHPNIICLEAAYTAAQTDTAIVTVGSGSKIVVTAIQVTLDEATTVGVGFRVGFGAANTPTTTGVVCSHAGLVPGGGLTVGNGGGMLGVGADGEDLRITSEVPTSGSLRVVVHYFTIDES